MLGYMLVNFRETFEKRKRMVQLKIGCFEHVETEAIISQGNAFQIVN